MKNDRSTAGAIAGLIGALTQQIFSKVFEYLSITQKDFGDFSGVMVMSHSFQGVLAHVVQWLGHMAVGMLLGIIFSWLFMFTSSKYWWFKGVVFGFIFWFLLTSIGTLFKMPVWRVITPRSAITLLIGSLIYSVITAYVLKLLDDKTELI